jgi:hypothetical protein
MHQIAAKRTQIRCVPKWKNAASSFIDTINEHCYGLIDDVLIESTVEGYVINADYYALL